MSESSYSIISFKASDLPKDYEPMVYSQWLRSLRYGNPAYKHIDTDEYYKNYHKYLENLLAKPDANVRLAVLSDDHDVVLGFSVNREDVLDYIHVHKDHRKLGIATMLLPKGITTFSHFTVVGLEIWQKVPRYKHLKCNPFA